MQLGELIEGHADHVRRASGLGKPVTRPLRFLQRIRPRPLQLHDLGTVHQALTAEGHQVRLRLTPAAQRPRPLLRPPQIEDLLTRHDHPQ